MRVGRFVLLAALLLAAFAAGWLKGAARKATPAPPWELADARLHLVERPRPCVPANDEERRAFELAAEVLALDSPLSSATTLHLGAKRFLAADLYRQEGPDRVRVCAPRDIYLRVARLPIWQNELKNRVSETHLELFSKLPEVNDDIVNAVGRAAFDTQPLQGIIRFKDIRPYARTILAGFGTRAAAYSAQAFDTMSNADSLGTGAAQIAVATRHPDVLPRVKLLMDELLSSVPADKTIPFNSRNRLYELAYAISLGGDDAKAYAAPVKTLMARKVQSWAGHYGMLDLRPKRMCAILERIEGSKAVEAYDFCIDPKTRFEQ